MTTSERRETASTTDSAMFGPYHLEQEIGRGGMGTVYRAYDTSRGRTVAVKRLNPELVGDTEYRRRFQRESEVVAQLSSPNVIPIHDFGEIDDELYIDMRLVSGVDLAAELRTHGRLDPARAVAIVRQLADALDAAHTEGLVHRDVKPSNVLLTPQRGGRDFVYLVDFGIVRSSGNPATATLTETGAVIGTYAYMAPEAFTRRRPDRRGDVYALGCVLFETLVGRPPFMGNHTQLMYQHVNAETPRASGLSPELPASLDFVLARALAKKPEERYDSAGALAEDAFRALRDASGTGLETTATVAVAESSVSIPRQQAIDPAGRGMTSRPGSPGITPGATMPSSEQRSPRVLRGRFAAAGALILAATVTVAALVFAPEAPSAPPTGSPPQAAPVTRAPVLPEPSPSPPPLGPPPNRVAAFPDITTHSCIQSADPDNFYITDLGIRPVALWSCRYPEVSTSAEVFYAQWPSTDAANNQTAGLMRENKSVDSNTTWSPAEEPAYGPYIQFRQEGEVYVAAGYFQRPYTFDFKTSTKQEADRLWDSLNSAPPANVPTS